MSQKKRILIVGATSVIAEHCIRQWLGQEKGPVELILVGRSTEKLTRIADDLKVRFPTVEIQQQGIDFLSTTSIQACIDQAYIESPIDIALVAHGTLPDQEACENNLVLAQQALEIKALSQCFC